MLDTELDHVPRVIAEAAEPLPDIDDPRFGAHVRPLRGCAGGAAGRSQPRHQRILPRPRGDHQAADRAPWLHHRRGRSRLARRRDASTATSGIGPRARTSSSASSAFRPGCGAIPTSTPSSAGCGATTRAAPRAHGGFYGLDLYNLNGSIQAVIDYLDKGSRARAARAPPLRLPRAVGRQSADLWPLFAARRLCAVRGRGGRRCSRTCFSARSIASPGNATTGSTPPPTRAW